MAQPTAAEIDHILRETLEDARLSRSEKRALAEVLADFDLGPEQQALVRNRAFTVAKEAIGDAAGRDLLKWLEGVVKVVHRQPKNTRATASSSVHFSPGDECRQRIARLLKGARKSADICVFTVTDDRLTEEVIEAHRRGVAVRLLADNDKAYDRGADVNRLRDAGVPVAVDVTDHHMHHKFAIFDARTVLTGSYNWTRSAARHNHENIVVTDDPTVVSPYRDKFAELWAELAEG